MSSGPREKEPAGNNEILDNDFLELVLFAIATQERCDILDLPPLYQVIDPEEVGLILEHGIVDNVTFSYFGYDVTVTKDKEVEIIETTVAEETTSQ